MTFAQELAATRELGDRIDEMEHRLEGISSIAEGNAFLPDWLAAGMTDYVAIIVRFAAEGIIGEIIGTDGPFGNLITNITREQFDQLWTYRSEVWARKFFDNWKAQLRWQRLEPYEKFAEMIEKHWDGIAAFLAMRAIPGVEAATSGQSGSESGAADGDRGVHLLREMLRIRRFEERCVELYSRAEIRGFLHLGIGEEACAVGVMEALSPDDAVVSTYREHGHALARG